MLQIFNSLNPQELVVNDGSSTVIEINSVMNGGYNVVRDSNSGYLVYKTHEGSSWGLSIVDFYAFSFVANNVGIFDDIDKVGWNYDSNKILISKQSGTICNIYEMDSPIGGVGESIIGTLDLVDSDLYLDEVIRFNGSFFCILINNIDNSRYLKSYDWTGTPVQTIELNFASSLSYIGDNRLLVVAAKESETLINVIKNYDVNIFDQNLLSFKGDVVIDSYLTSSDKISICTDPSTKVVFLTIYDAFSALLYTYEVDFGNHPEFITVVKNPSHILANGTSIASQKVKVLDPLLKPVPAANVSVIVNGTLLTDAILMDSSNTPQTEVIGITDANGEFEFKYQAPTEVGVQYFDINVTW